MESLHEGKFQQLTSQEMNLIEGGGWRVDEFQVYWNPYEERWESNTIKQRYTLLGKPTGEYHTGHDICK